MAFTHVPKMKPTGGRQAIVNRVRLMRCHGNGATLLIARDLAEAAGLTECVALSVGTGADAGRLMISPSPAGYKLRRPAKGSAPHVQLPMRLMGERPAMAMTVRHELTPDGLIVNLGRYLKSDQPAESDTADHTYEARAA